MPETKCIKACRSGQEVQLFRPNVRIGKKCNLNDFHCGMIVGARQSALSISEAAVSRVCRDWCDKQKHNGQKCLVNERGQRKRARLVKADRKVRVMQISKHYNSGMQKSISEHTTHQASKWTGYSSRIPISLIKFSLSVYWG